MKARQRPRNAYARQPDVVTSEIFLSLRANGSARRAADDSSANNQKQADWIASSLRFSQ
jgi:hypothetical protein